MSAQEKSLPHNREQTKVSRRTERKSRTRRFLLNIMGLSPTEFVGAKGNKGAKSSSVQAPGIKTKGGQPQVLGGQPQVLQGGQPLVLQPSEGRSSPASSTNQGIIFSLVVPPVHPHHVLSCRRTGPRFPTDVVSDSCVYNCVVDTMRVGSVRGGSVRGHNNE